MRRLDDRYPQVFPANASGYLDRGDGHSIYFEEAGNPKALPLVVCHGGPGGSNNPQHRRLLDSNLFRIIQFDQRGCGKSQPTGELKNNSLQHSIADMEALRAHLGIERWAVVGGSWGATLALAYAQQHPDKTQGLLLVSLWLCRRIDVDWWFQGVRTVFPELWDQFSALVPASNRADLRQAYCDIILGDDPERAQEAGRRLYLYEEGFMRFDAPLMPPDASRGPAYARIFAYYAAHDFFLKENQLIEEAGRLDGIPVILLTGRYDMCTTPNNAYDLAQVLSSADLRIVPGAGHYPTEIPLSRACVEAVNDLHQKITRCD